MIDVIIQAAGLIALGVLWRHFRPLSLDGDTLRHSLTTLVYVLLLPALVLAVIWDAPLGVDTLRIAAVAVLAIAAGFLLGWSWVRLRHVPPATAGALLLAAAFPNATYMGLPVLEATFGPWGRSVAIQYDLFAATPLLLSVGVMVAAHYSPLGGERAHPLKALLKVPPLWAAAIAVGLNLAGVPLPVGLGDWLSSMGGAVVPLMLFALGLGLRWGGSLRIRLPALLVIVLLQLLITPLVAWGAASGLGLRGDLLVAVVLEAAMPSMVLGIVLCDRYRLDTALYAMAVTVTTLLSLLALPFWFRLLA